MNVLVRRNGTDITNQVTSIKIEKSICSFMGVLNLGIIGTSTVSCIPNDSIEITLDSVKIGTFYVQTSGIEGANKIVIAQDASWRLRDYFITDNYFIDYPTFTRYWIELFLTEAGIDYVFDTDSYGTLIQNDDNLGMASCLDVITKLLQQSGWFLIFDADNIAHIGKLEKNPDLAVAEINDTEILEITTHKDDLMLRNRAIVWGKANPYTRKWVQAYKDRLTGYESHENDYRSVVISNSNIWNNTDAKYVASQIINEFAKITEIKTVTFPGVKSISVGQTVFISSKYFTGYGLVTNAEYNVSSSGMITKLTLDQRCPRLIAFFSTVFVYVATDGNGIWRKSFTYPDIWRDFSSGIASGDKHVTDLKIYDGIFACVAGQKFYYRTGNTSWVKYNVTSLTDDLGNVSTSLVCVGCAINKTKGTIYGLFTDRSNQKSWVLEITASGQLVKNTYVLNNGRPARIANPSLRTFDIDHCWDKTVITGLIPGENYFNGIINRNSHRGLTPVNSIDSYNTVISFTGNSSAFATGGSGKVILAYNDYIYYADVALTRFYRKNIRTGETKYITVPTAIDFEIFSLVSADKALIFAGALLTVDFPSETFEFVSLSGYGYTAYSGLTAGIVDQGGKAHIFWNGYVGTGFYDNRLLYSTYDNGVLSPPQDVTPAQEADCGHYRAFPQLFWVAETRDCIIGLMVYQDKHIVHGLGYNDGFISFVISGSSVTVNRFELNAGTYVGTVEYQLVPDFDNNACYLLTSNGQTLSSRYKLLKINSDASVELILNETGLPYTDIPPISITSSKDQAYYTWRDTGETYTLPDSVYTTTLPSGVKLTGAMDDRGYFVYLKSASATRYDIGYNYNGSETLIYSGYNKSNVTNRYPSLMGQYLVFGNNMLAPNSITDLVAIGAGGNSYPTLIETTSGYDIIDSAQSPLTIEVDQDGLIVTFPIASSSYTVSGIGVSALASPSTLNTNLRIGSRVGGTYTFIHPSGGSFVDIAYSGAAISWVDDVRTFYLYPPDIVADGLMIASGIDDECYIAIATGGLLKNNYANLSAGWGTVSGIGPSGISVSGIKLVETSNYETAYFCMTSGTSPRFFEKAPGFGKITWVEGTANFPSGYAPTVIRVDDLF